MSASQDCPSEETLTSFVGGQLPASDKQNVTEHLHHCAACRAVLARIGELTQPLGDPAGDLSGTATRRTDQREVPTGSFDREQEAAFDLLDPQQSPPSLGKLNEYQVLRVLGRGGYGIVLEARDSLLNRTVAIKVLQRHLANRATSRRRFIREARAGAAINHPNVVTIHGVDEAADIPFLIMELIRGETLRDRIHREPKLDLMEVLRISAQIAQGLAAAHAQGVIHRDVKPGNVMLVDGQRVKITDFGLARVAMEDVEPTSLGLDVGTPAYISPEQVRGEDVDSRSDLFALGCVIYAMFTGHSPFQGQSALEIARRIDGYQPPRLREVNPAVPEFLDSMVQRLLQKDREDRYQSAAEVADVLNRHLSILNQTPTDRLPAALKMQLAESSPRKRSTWSIGRVALVLLLVAAAGWGANYVRSAWLQSATPSRSAATIDGDSAAATTPLPLAERRATITVAKSGTANSTTIGEALRLVAPGGTITVQDQAEYVEPLRLDDPARFAGVRLIATDRAVLRSTEQGPVIKISGVPGLQVKGFKIVAPQARFGIEVSGNCPGLQLEDIQIHRTVNDDGSTTGSAALALRDGAAGSAEQPIRVRNVSLRATNVGIVLMSDAAAPTGLAASLRHIVIEECSLEGLSRESSTLLALLNDCEDVIIRRNILAHGMQGLSIVAAADSLPIRCQIQHNTWHDVASWIVWTGPTDGPISLEFRHNLLVEVGAVGPNVRALAAAGRDPPTFLGNVVVNQNDPEAGEFASLAMEDPDFPLLSTQPSDPHYLQPDFARLKLGAGASGPTPGRYSPDSSP